MIETIIWTIFKLDNNNKNNYNYDYASSRWKKFIGEE